MLFQRCPRYDKITLTDRKKAAVERRQRTQAMRYPLIADQLPSGPVDFAAEEERRNTQARAAEQRMRDLFAKHWKHGRAQFSVTSPEVREVIRKAWRAWTGPRTPTNYIYVVEEANGVADARRAVINARDSERHKKFLESLGRQEELF